MNLTPQRPDMECSLLKLPHYLQACTEILPNMEGVVCKQISDVQSNIMCLDFSKVRKKESKREVPTLILITSN